MKHQNLKISLVVIIFLASITGGFGKEITFEKNLTPFKYNANIEVVEDHYYQTLSNANWNQEFGYRYANGWVKLKAETHYEGSYIEAYAARVVVLIKTYEPGSVLYNSETRVLEVQYSPEEGLLVSNNEFMNENQVNLKGNPLRVKVNIVTIYINGNVVGSAPLNLAISAGIKVDRYHDFDPYALPSSALNTLPAISNSDAEEGKEIEISWNEIYGAEYYELEWTYIDQVDYDHSASYSASQINSGLDVNNIQFTELDFKHNATRVQLTNQHNLYKIPLIYPRGYIVYRIRGIGQQAQVGNNGYFGPGLWSTDDGTVKEVLSDWSGAYIEFESGFQENLAKQVELAFIENGRRKEIVTYFDGTGRDRQMVTRSEHISDTITVVAESVYDYLGRKALSFMPAPSYDGNYYANTISYTHNFNLKDETPAKPFSASDFDTQNTTGECLPDLTAASSESGAARYYGANFTELAENTIWNKYVPESYGYPFSFVEFTRDNTGRVRNQGGVGPEFQVQGGKHYSKMYYGAPDQEELDRLFGFEVGFKKFYRKNMAIDPNNQASFTYIDPQGRTIATSIAGNEPPNLEELPNVLPIAAAQVDLLGNLAGSNLPQFDLPYDNNILSADGMHLTYSGTYLSPIDNNPFRLDYALKASKYSDHCTTELYDYKYNLDLRAESDCDELEFAVSPVSVIPATGHTWSAEPLTASGTTVDIGEYHISKTLSIDEDYMYATLDLYISDAIANGSCISTLEEIETYLMDESNSDIYLNCTSDCEACSTAVQADYAQGLITNIEKLSLLEDCGFQCQGEDPLSMCESFRMMMKADMSPGGQYGNTEGIDPTSIYYPRSATNFNSLNAAWYDTDIWYQDPDGGQSWVEVYLTGEDYTIGSNFNPPVFDAPNTGNYGVNTALWKFDNITGVVYTIPNNLQNVSDFLTGFEPSWAETLISKHPEFCLLSFCENIDGSSDNIDFITNLNNEAWILSQGGLLPDPEFIDNETYQEYLIDDPFWDIASGDLPEEGMFYLGFLSNYFNQPYVVGGISLRDEFLNRLEEYLVVVDDLGDQNPTNDEVVATYSITDIAANLNTCGGSYGSDCFNSLATVDTDEERALLKSLYIGVRTVILQKAALYYALDNGCYNECIGSVDEMSYYAEITPELTVTNLGSSVCGNEDSWMFQAKVRRYGIAASIIDPPQVTSNVGVDGSGWDSYNVNGGFQSMNNITGLCPNEFILLSFVRGLIEDEQVFGGHTGSSLNPINLENPADGYYGFSPLLYDIINPPSDGISSGNYVLQGTITPNTLHYDFVPSPQSATCSMEFVIESEAATVLSWADYDPLADESSPNTWRISNLSFYGNVSSNTFYLIATVIGDTGGLDEILLECNTCINLQQGCVQNETCQPTGLATELKEMLNIMLTNGNLFSTTGIFIGAQGYAGSFANGSIMNYLGVSLDDLEYIYNPTDDEIRIGTFSGDPTKYIAISSIADLNDFGIYNHVVSVNPTGSSTAGEMSVYVQGENNLGMTVFQNIDLLVERVFANTANFYDPILFTCANDFECPPSDGEINPHDIVEMFMFFISNGAAEPGSATLIDWIEAMPDYAFSDGLTQDWWISNFIQTLYVDENGFPIEPFWSVGQTLVEISENPILDEMGQPTGEVTFVISISAPAHFDEDLNYIEEILLCDFEIVFLPEYSDAGEIANRNNTTQPCTFPSGVDGTNFMGFCPDTHEGAYQIYTDEDNPGCFIYTTSLSASIPDEFQYGTYTYQICSSCAIFTQQNCGNECVSIPEPLGNYPQSCNAAYDDYNDSSTGVPGYVTDYVVDNSTDIFGTTTTTTSDDDHNPFASEAEFCEFQLGPRVGDYLTYLNDITTVLSTSNLAVSTLTSSCYPEVTPFNYSCWFYVPIETFVSGSYYLSLNPGTVQNPLLTYTDFIGVIANLDEAIFSDLFMTLGEFHAGDYSNYCLESYIDEIGVGNYINLQDFCTGPGQLPNPIIYCPEYQTSTTSLTDLVSLSGITNDDPTTVLTEYCNELGIEYASQNAWLIYEAQIQELTENFLANYIEGAMSSVKEKFLRTTASYEHHYTLYFYDKAGNLTKTVPPEGVNQILTNPPANFNLTQVSADRILGTRSIASEIEYPLTTNYKYNSLGQLTYQNTPDGGETNFYYDDLGRLKAFQNAKQAQNDHFSYTSYDELGRIVQSGELTATSAPNATALNDNNFPNFSTWVGMQQFSRKEMVISTYDQPLNIPGGTSVADYFGTDGQQNLRNRITTVRYAASQDGGGYPEGISNATHYSYDIHGNVKTLIQEFPDLARLDPDINNKVQSTKRIDYDYDLISGSVKEVSYQKSYADQFYHRYFYDSQNRLTRATTSLDGILWEEDARYYYYAHGPLARTELGQNQIQGTDYAYTLQGWLKGVNSDKLTAINDIGKDASASANRAYSTTADAYGYHLDYFDDGETDYSPRGNLAGTGNQNCPFASFTAAATNPLPSYSLYNGNIARMSTTIYAEEISQPGYIAKTPQLMSYRYDQLNRISGATNAVSAGFNSVTNIWTAESADIYKSDYTYDANGNIENLSRTGNITNNYGMDELRYYYYPGTNKLSKVIDLISTTPAYDNDIEYNPGIYDYKYDAIGNLSNDLRDKILIDWFVNGKVKAMRRHSGVSGLPDLEYAYGPMGNRVTKLEKTRTGTTMNVDTKWRKTYYVRDAQGNVMATYERTWSEANAGTFNKRDKLVLKEQHVYGSSRLAVRNTDLRIAYRPYKVIATSGTTTIKSYANTVNTTHPNWFVSTYVVGKKKFELANHLGNVLSVISDNVWANKNGGGDITHFTPDIVAANDYYTFGMIMPGRNYSSDSYRYGFNGKEKDDEVKGSGNQYDYGFRIYDTRIAKFLSVDPLASSFPWFTPYQYAGNSPIKFIDLDGLETAPNRGDAIPSFTKPNGVLETLTEGWRSFFGFDIEDPDSRKDGDLVRYMKQKEAASLRIVDATEKINSVNEIMINLAALPLDAVGDVGTALYYTLNGDMENAGYSAAAIFVPFANGGTLRLGKNALRVLDEAPDLKKYLGNFEILSKGLSDEMIQKSDLIIEGVELNNDLVKEAIKATGTDISNWGKYTTKTQGAEIGDYQIHFYMNKRTGEVIQHGMKAKINKTQVEIPFD